MLRDVLVEPLRAPLVGGFAPVAAEFGMEWELHDTAVQPRVLIMVSKAGHCLNDLLYRRAAESLRIDVPLVVGKYDGALKADARPHLLGRPRPVRLAADAPRERPAIPSRPTT